jgi:hypothetical protein
MNACAPDGRCYLVEWYRRDWVERSMEAISAELDETTASMCAEGSPVQLVTMLAVPADEVVFAVFVAASKEIVAEACKRAALPADRLSAAARTVM